MKYSPISYKSITGQEVDGNKVCGYLASFGNVDSDGDVIINGAFKKSLDERGVGSNTNRKISYLYHHDMTRPIGRFTTLVEDAKGLYFEAELDDIQLAKDVAVQYKSGTLNQHSIGFRYIWDKCEVDTNSSVMYVKEVDLFEGSVVTMGANDNTPFIGFKSATIEDMDIELRKETEAFLKHIPFEEQFKMRQLISKHISLAKSEPGHPTHKHIGEPKPIDWANIINNLKFD